jgi:hypothetical protein
VALPDVTVRASERQSSKTNFDYYFVGYARNYLSHSCKSCTRAPSSPRNEPPIFQRPARLLLSTLLLGAVCASADLQRIVAAKTEYTPQNVGRRSRELENEGMVEVRYVRLKIQESLEELNRTARML